MNPLLLKSIGTGFNLASFLSPHFAGKKAFDLFCLPFSPPLANTHRKWLEKSSKIQLDSQNEKIQIYKWGDGPRKILFLHGWQSHSFRWKNYIDRLSDKDYTLYAIDAPAHGLSEGKYFQMPKYAEAVNQFYNEVDQPDVVVGHSIGAMTTIYGTVTHQSITPKALVLLATAAKMSDFLIYFQKTLGLNNRTLDLIGKRVQNLFDHPPSHFDMTEYSKQLKVPGLLIHDPSDEVASIVHAKKIAENWSHSELMITEGLDHKLRSEIVYNRTIDFIQKQFAVTV